MPILILGSPKDPHVKVVTDILEQQHSVQVLHYGFNEFPTKSGVGIRLDGTRCHGQWKTSHGNFALEEISSVWYRRPGRTQGPGRPTRKDVRAYIEKESESFWENLECLFPNALLLPDPMRVKIADNKLYQLKLAAQLGFRIPSTCIGNDSDTVGAFFDQHDGLLVKAFKQVYIKLDFDLLGRVRAVLWEHFNKKTKEEFFPIDYGYREFISVPSKLVPKSDRAIFLEQVPSCPVIVQQYIPKKLELRITVVGEQLFPCAIHSQEGPEKARVDWRLATDDLRHEPYDLPPEIREKCLALVKALGLRFGCIDMIVTPEGEYVFLEINPNGQWFWIQEFTGMPIAEAIAELLAIPSSSGSATDCDAFDDYRN